MTQFVSPGVYTLENDLSQYVSDLSSTIVAMVGTSDNGPTNSPTLITSISQMVSTFGDLNPNHYMSYAAQSYLKQGSILYVNRVAASDASVAKITMPVPATYTPYSGDWTLTSQTTNSATFTAVNGAGTTGANQMIALPASPNVYLPGFDFTDSTNAAALQTLSGNKIGSDLMSFTTSDSLTNKYVIGREFRISSGVGKDTFATITGIAEASASSVSITVNSNNFNPFNSPTTATASGTAVFQADPTFVVATAVDLFKVGSTNTGGTVTVRYDGTNALDAATFAGLLASDPTTALNGKLVDTTTNILRVSGSNVIISVPIYNTSGVISTAQAKLNATLISSVLTNIITIFRSGVTLTGGLLAISALCQASSAGIVGIGNVDLVTGLSQGIKSAEVQADGVTVKLSAIVQGANGNFDPHSTALPVVVTTPMQITGSFALDLFRPTWVMSAAGSSFAPELLKLSSIGQADYSNIAVSLDINTTKVDSSGDLLYTLSFYQRIVSPTTPLDSVSQSDFILLESYLGTPEVLQSSVNANSSYFNLKLDYSTTDTLSYTTGAVVYGSVPDYLTCSFGLVEDLGGLGAQTGLDTVIIGSTFVPAYSDFMLGGSLGSLITKDDIIGNVATKTGLYGFYDPELIDVNILVAPGWSADPSVAKAMVGICESRSDCMAILDTPFGLTVQNVINYKNNVLNINSNYAAIYYPWVKITDAVNNKDVFVPPSGMVAGQYAYNDLVGDVFSAPAGRNRGNLTDAIATERILNQGDRDVLAIAHINPIHFEAGYGIYIRGQMTLQTATTALDRVNVRRLLLQLRKVIATASKAFEFEPGDSITALRLKQLAESTLEDRLRKGAIRSYTVDVGPNVNTAATLENNELWMSISLVPTKTAEKIIEVFNILGQGQGISIGT